MANKLTGLKGFGEGDPKPEGAKHKALTKKASYPSIAQIKKANPLFFDKKTTKFFGDKKHTYDRKSGTYHVKHSHRGHTYKVDPTTHELNP